MEHAFQHWICCQIGAREHYGLARALHSLGVLECLLTEAWVPPGHPLTSAFPRFAQRHHPALGGARVAAFNWRTLLFEGWLRALAKDPWQRTLRRNAWFQRQALRELKVLSPYVPAGPSTVLFAYSYAAKALLKYAREQGWSTILGQIDPGPPGHPLPTWETQPAPSAYWDQWREECALADAIVVNSDWSRQCLGREGVAEEKMHIIPLAYEGGGTDTGSRRVYPDTFTDSRPLHVLALGRLSPRKGTPEILEAVRLLSDAPVQWHLVGDRDMTVPDDMVNHPRLTLEAGIPRHEVDARYKAADVFLFPSHSDGFGLTQLEAQRWKLPVIASRNCGQVVTDGVNGLLLKAPTADAILEAVKRCLEHPRDLQAWSDASEVAPEYSLSSVAVRYTDLAARLASRQTRRQLVPPPSPA